MPDVNDTNAIWTPRPASRRAFRTAERVRRTGWSEAHGDSDCRRPRVRRDSRGVVLGGIICGMQCPTSGHCGSTHIASCRWKRAFGKGSMLHALQAAHDADVVPVPFESLMSLISCGTAPQVGYTMACTPALSMESIWFCRSKPKHEFGP